MRAFWAIVLVLLLGGAAAAFFVAPHAPAPSPVGQPPAVSPATPANPQPLPLTSSLPAPSAAPPAPAPPKPAESSRPIDFKLDLENAINTAAGTTPTAPQADKPPAPTAGTPVELPMSAAWPAAKTSPSKAVRIDDELVIDGRFHVKGSGTEADPYVVPFDLLMSAAESYDPRKGLTRMPQRVAFLHDKHVRITGYIAFPISATDPHQALVMFNQWDGCCIGVPPTTYDSIETNLQKPATGDDKFITFGTTAGVLKVDPYIDNGWLLGLYVLDHTTLTNGKVEPISPKQLPAN
jgi:hypothetical protein